MVKIKVRPKLMSQRGFRTFASNQNKKSKMIDKESLKKLAVGMSTSRHNIEVLPSPIKSNSDTKDYRVIKLENGLTALLISDPSLVEDAENDESDYESSSEESDESQSSSDEEDSELEQENEEPTKKADSQGQKLAAAGLCIGVGSFSDPDDVPGLAHFLEHMVFMGSEKYPEENSFDAFIKRRGGDSNAYTDCEHTTFYFEIHKKHLYEALDRFAHFFISPLLKKDSVDREIEAVDSEFHSCLQSDEERKDQLLGSFANSGHPMGKFFWGNKHSLKENPLANNIDVYSKLTEFRKKYYTANLMTLAIQSQEKLETLEEWVKEIFGKVPNNNSELLTFSHLERPYETEAFRRLYKVESVGSSHLLRLTWAFPPLLHHYKEKPLDYIFFLIGHEGRGSLLSYLKQKIWALNLWTEDCTNDFERNTSNTLFRFTVELTELGMEHLFDVITAVFSYIKMLNAVGPEKRIFEEIQLSAENEFKWQEEINAIDLVERLAGNMQFFPSEHYFTGEELFLAYDESLIRECMSKLTPDNVNIIVMSKVYEVEGICNEKESWFQTPYTSCEIDPNWIHIWKNAEILPEFYTPTPNPFIATDFSLKPVDLNNKADVPIIINDDNAGKVWYKQDCKFQSPKAIIRIHLASPIIGKSALNATLADLFLSALDQNLKEDVYPAQVAMLEYTIQVVSKGLLITVFGFNHKLIVLFETIIDHITKFDISDSLFDAVKASVGKSYYNTFIKPSKLASDTQRSILYNNYWSTLEKNASLPEATKEKLLKFVEEFKSRLYIESLCQGNLTSEEALNSLKIVVEKLNNKSVSLSEIPENQTVVIPQESSYCRVVGLNSDDEKSVVVNYYQLGTANIRSSCMMELIINFMEEPCFDYLRTQEQLGYNVYCLECKYFGIIGFGVTVHTSAKKFSCFQVDTKIEEFLTHFRKIINNVTEEEFKIQVTSLIKMKQHPDLHFKDEVARNSAEILNRNYVFDRLQKEVQCLQSITFRELQDWFTKGTINGSHFNKLSIQVVGNGKCDKSTDNVDNKKIVVPQLNYLEINDEMSIKYHVISDCHTFKKELDLFPNTKITS